MKYLLVFALIGLVFWMWRSQRMDHKNRPDKQPADKPTNSSGSTGTSRTLVPATEMVACAFCQVHLPRPDAVAGQQALYCSTAHKQLAGE